MRKHCDKEQQCTPICTTQARLLMILRKKVLENIVEKGKMLLTNFFSISLTEFPSFQTCILLSEPHEFRCLQFLSVRDSVNFYCLVKV